MRKFRDGWHKIAGYNIYVENNRVMRGLKGPEWNPVPSFPYRWSKNLHCWCAENMTVDAFRAGVKRDVIKML